MVTSGLPAPEAAGRDHHRSAGLRQHAQGVNSECDCVVMQNQHRHVVRRHERFRHAAAADAQTADVDR